MYGYNAGQPMAIPIYAVLPYCVMLYFAGDSMLIMRSHGVSTAVKRDAADDI